MLKVKKINNRVAGIQHVPQRRTLLIILEDPYLADAIVNG